MGGEMIVQTKVIGAKFAMLPCKNPFSMATTLLDEGMTPDQIGVAGKGWSCGNSFWYTICGIDQSRRHHIPPGNKQSRSIAIAAALNKPDIPEDQLLGGCGNGLVAATPVPKAAAPEAAA